MNFDARAKDGYTGFVDDPETEALKARYQREPDPAKQKVIAEEMQKRAYDQVFYISLGTYKQFVALRPELKGYVNSPVVILWNVAKS
jgi:peptide/nickel transport system substrate-binding protein